MGYILKKNELDLNNIIGVLEGKSKKDEGLAMDNLRNDEAIKMRMRDNHPQNIAARDHAQ